MPNIAVVFYSSTGHVHQLADAVGQGASDAGADVRVRMVAELAPDEVIQGQPAWKEHHERMAEQPSASPDDMEWADGFALGTPTRFGNPAAQLKQFIDTLGPLWQAGTLADKAATSFTSAINRHGGQESTILAVNNVFYHWGAIIVPPGYTDPLLYEAGGNPYGTSFVVGGQDPQTVPEATLAAARHQGKRLAEVAAKLRGDT